MIDRIVLLVLAVFLATNASANDIINELKDKKLITILNNMEVAADNTKIHKNLSIRIIKVKDFGECDSKPESCPKEKMYVAVSEYGEYPEQKLFVVQSYGWEFVRWIEPKSKNYQDFVVKKNIISNDKKFGWFKEELITYRVTINTMQEIK